MRGPIENTAKRAAALAERFEAARKQAQNTPMGTADSA
jgi:hypothetical protein